MEKPVHPIVRHAMDTASANALAILQERGMKPGQLGDKAEKAKVLSRKTVYNVLGQTKKPSLESLAQVAELLEIPLWTLLLPNIHKHRELLRPGALKGIAKVVADYLESNSERRADIEKIAHSSASLTKIDK